MHRIPSEFSSKTVAVLPITRLVFEGPFRVGSYFFFPPDEFDVRLLNPIPPLNLEDHRVDGMTVQLEGSGLRKAKSAIAGLSIEVLHANPLLVFESNIDWSHFDDLSHDDDVEIVKRLSSEAEKVLDVIRFFCCRFDLPDTLPGLVGSWEGSGQFLGALIYNPHKNESHLLSGSAVECSIIVKGIGLQIDGPPPIGPPDPKLGEVSAITAHALSLFSDVMNASNETTKYVRAMTLLEFLGSPDEFRTWRKLKGELICHFAKDKIDYLRLTERFKELTSKQDDNDPETGLRTLIVHHGKFLHELVPDRKKRKQLFMELQRYAERVLKDMLSHGSSTWESFSENRKELRRRLGVA